MIDVGDIVVDVEDVGPPRPPAVLCVVALGLRVRVRVRVRVRIKGLDKGWGKG